MRDGSQILLTPQAQKIIWSGSHRLWVAELELKSTCVYVPNRFSRVQLCVILWTVAGQAPLSMGFSRQEYWPPSGDLPYPRIKLVSLRSPALAGGIFTTSATLDCKSSVWPRKSLLPFFFFLAGKSFSLPPLSPTSDTVTVNGSTDGKGEEGLNWWELKVFSAEGKAEEKEGHRTLGAVSKQLSSGESWMPPSHYEGVKRVKCCLAFLEGESKCVLGGSKNGSTCCLGERSWEENYYGKVEKRKGRNLKVQIGN